MGTLRATLVATFSNKEIVKIPCGVASGSVRRLPALHGEELQALHEEELKAIVGIGIAKVAISVALSAVPSVRSTNAVSVLAAAGAEVIMTNIVVSILSGVIANGRRLARDIARAVLIATTTS